MNKEEIEESKKCLNETIQNTYAERKAIKLDNLRKYIQHLEQKSETLDKATDKLKKDIENNYCIEELIGDSFATVGVKRYPTKQYAQEILNSMEGEKKQ